MNMHDPDVNEARYMQVIHFKTGKLFEASSALGALLAKATPEQYAAAQAYGKHIGATFQLVDDILDYTASAEQMGKNAGDRFAGGKANLAIDLSSRSRHSRTKIFDQISH